MTRAAPPKTGTHAHGIIDVIPTRSHRIAALPTSATPPRFVKAAADSREYHYSLRPIFDLPWQTTMMATSGRRA